MSARTHPTTGNLLLDTLPTAEYDRLAPHLESVSLITSQVLFRPGDHLAFAYFPTNSIISLLTDLEDGEGMEVGLVGKEGVVGISIILGGKETKVATVQADGCVLKVGAGVIREEFSRNGAVQAALLRYTHALMTQISQSVVCNVRHPVAGRLARWLLMYHDRSGVDEFSMTHEFMAHMLGVRRSGVSEIAGQLQKKGLINYHRGRIHILDRRGLEKLVCECYPVVKEKFDTFLLQPFFNPDPH